MLSSSIQATLIGKYKNSDYGVSKLEGEKLFFNYAKEQSTEVLVYRFPNLFGKWCKPNYNSVVATWCYNYANDLEIQINNPDAELELVYIDDLVKELLDALEGKEHRCRYEGLETIEDKNGEYCFVPTSHKVTLGEIVNLLDTFKSQPENLIIPDIPNNSFILLMQSSPIARVKADGTKVLMRSILELLPACPKVLLIITGNGPYLEELKQYAVDLCIQDKVLFTGWVDNPFVPLHICDLYTHITLGEGGLSLAVLEAMAMGKPIVAATVGGIPEAITDGENGLLVAPEVELVAEKIDLLLRDRGYAERLGRCAKATVEKKFTWEQAAERFLEICRCAW